MVSETSSGEVDTAVSAREAGAPRLFESELAGTRLLAAVASAVVEAGWVVVSKIWENEVVEWREVLVKKVSARTYVGVLAPPGA